MGPTKVLISLVLLFIVKENLIKGNNTTTYLENNHPTIALAVESLVPERVNETTCTTIEDSGIEETTTARIKRKKKRTLKITDLLKNPKFQTLVQVHTGLKIHGKLTVAAIGTYKNKYQTCHANF